MTVIYYENDNNTISFVDSTSNMTMVKTSNQDPMGNFYWNIQGSDGNLITSTNFSHTEAFYFIQKKKTIRSQ